MNIFIIGCGWLGLPAGIHLSQNGHNVAGTTTTIGKLKLLDEAGIVPHLLHIEGGAEDADFPDSFFTSDIVIINIPPRLRHAEPARHLEQIDVICRALRQSVARQVCFVSSTSVYPDCNGTVDEQTVAGEDDTTANHTLLKAEQKIRDLTDKTVVILRLGGLLGYDRIPVKYFAGKTEVPGAHAPVNFIHRDDAVRALATLCEKGFKAGTYNLCAPNHPLRGQLYPADAQKYGYTPPVFATEDQSPWKLVKADKFVATYGFEFHFPHPENFYYQTKND